MSETGLEAIALEELGEHSNLLQSSFWGSLKGEFGWKPLAFRLDGRLSASGERGLLVLVRELGFGQSLAYVPHGPMSGSVDSTAGWELTAELAGALMPYLPKSCMFIRFDPPWGVNRPALDKEAGGYPEDELSPGRGGAAAAFRKAQMDIQPPSTVILGLNQSEEELLKGMKSKTRYNIRLAAKKGVEVRTAGIEALPEWYELYRITGERDKIALHSYDYYERIFTLAAEQPNGTAPELRLLLAVIDGVIEAGIVTCRKGKRATYLYGASSNNKRNYMPAYALQWKAIKQAAADGCTEYDFFGIPPVDNPEHPMYGLYRFKTGFGGDILHRPGCWDYPYKKNLYSLYRAAERARYFYYKKLKKR